MIQEDEGFLLVSTISLRLVIKELWEFAEMGTQMD